MSEQFVKLPMKVLLNKNLSLYERVIYAYIVDRIGGNDDAWPSIGGVASRIGLSPKTVAAALKELEKQGLLKIVRIHGKTNRYSLPEPHPNPTQVKSDLGQIRPRSKVTHDSDSTRRNRDNHDKAVVVSTPGNPDLGCKMSPPPIPPPPPIPKKKPADPANHKVLVNILAEQCYPDIEMTRSDWGRVGKAAQSLVRDGIGPVELVNLINAYRRDWDRVTLTPTAISNNVANLRKLVHEGTDWYEEMIFNAKAE